MSRNRLQGQINNALVPRLFLKPKEKTVKEELELEEGRHVHSRDLSSSAVFYFFSSTLNYFNRSVTEI